jgi:hypothetical protein
MMLARRLSAAWLALVLAVLPLELERCRTLASPSIEPSAPGASPEFPASLVRAARPLR